jgi:hypothetical protein
MDRGFKMNKKMNKILKIHFQFVFKVIISSIFINSVLFLNISLASNFNLINQTPSKPKLNSKLKNKTIENTKTVFLGHLLTPTTSLPEKETFTTGTHIMGYSFTDSLLVGTSSFLALLYNSPNVFLKTNYKINSKNILALQANYLKSDPNFRPIPTTYIMEAVMLWGVWSRRINRNYTLHTSLNYMNFFNEGNPHSLRREPFNHDPYQFSLTTLHDIKVSETFGLASEIGILGLNYRVPNLHTAVSFRWIRKNYFFQAGVSFDTHFPGINFDTESYIRNNQTLSRSHTKESVIHPEFAFQYFF